ncbi:hypothetical protein [Mesorhizobium sp. B2-4-6]|uniref:hypothetical protein n=1 Tax=Mesorhizobium sp. B2-4-6 TaxID=2589943 RepID=UPI00112EBB43|nr:hypothetical protein [Mesorhizobium sp. B2-4-6]TPL49895.1 hypothetical protein FJ957_12635 [Mesorhizobium sp. B2-4-6]
MTSIVYVDDDADGLLGSLSEEYQRLFRTFNPNNKEEANAAFEAAAESDLWVFDFFYSNDRTQQSALEEDNGLSLFQKWRRLKLEERPPTALVSSDLERAIGPGIPRARAHVLAQRAGVEWVGDKTQASAAVLVELADASSAIQKAVGALVSDDKATNADRITNEETCLRLLNLPKDSSWRSSAERHLDRARPPQLSSVSHPQAKARLLLAWLLHNVFPYPSFLITSYQSAIRLGITTASFDSLSRDETSDLGHQLRAVRYQGPFGTVGADRWWRAGIDDIVWNFSQSKIGYAEALRVAAGGVPIRLLEIDDPVIVSDVDLVETTEIASARDCVRAQDEHFPSDVPPAWVKLVDAREHAELGEKVIFEDRELLAVTAQ